MGNQRSQEIKALYLPDSIIIRQNINDESIGKFQTFTIAQLPGQLLLRKTFDPTSYSESTDIKRFVQKLCANSPLVCEFHFYEEARDGVYELVFDYGVNLASKALPEQRIWDLLLKVTEIIAYFEHGGTHYGRIDPKFLLVSQRGYRVVNPFCFPEYIKDMLQVYLNPMIPVSKKKEFSALRIDANITELGFTVLSLMDNRLNSKALASDPQYLSSVMNAFSSVVSPGLLQVLDFLLKKPPRPRSSADLRAILGSRAPKPTADLGPADMSPYAQRSVSPIRPGPSTPGRPRGPPFDIDQSTPVGLRTPGAADPRMFSSNPPPNSNRRVESPGGSARLLFRPEAPENIVVKENRSSLRGTDFEFLAETNREKNINAYLENKERQEGSTKAEVSVLDLSHQPKVITFESVDPKNPLSLENFFNIPPELEVSEPFDQRPQSPLAAQPKVPQTPTTPQPQPQNVTPMIPTTPPPQTTSQRPISPQPSIGKTLSPSFGGLSLQPGAESGKKKLVKINSMWVEEEGRHRNIMVYDDGSTQEDAGQGPSQNLIDKAKSAQKGPELPPPTEQFGRQSMMINYDYHNIAQGAGINGTADTYSLLLFPTQANPVLISRAKKQPESRIFQGLKKMVQLDDLRKLAAIHGNLEEPSASEAPTLHRLPPPPPPPPVPAPVIIQPVLSFSPSSRFQNVSFGALQTQPTYRPMVFPQYVDPSKLMHPETVVHQPVFRPPETFIPIHSTNLSSSNTYRVNLLPRI